MISLGQLTSVWLICGTFWWATMLSSCAARPQVLSIPSVTDTVEPTQYGTRDYAAVFAAIMSVMVRDLKLPPIQGGSVTIYSSQASFEAGALTHSAETAAMIQKQFGLGPEQMKEIESIAAASATRMAVGATALGMYKRVLVNDWRLAKYPWSEWVRVIAHELTHSATKELADGKPAVPDQWLSEGFAEWVGYKVVANFGAQDFAASRRNALDSIINAMSYQTLPGLGQLARNADWITWSRILGLPSTYGQGFIAVDFLIDDKGLPAVVEYFRLFKTLNNRERNFATAFVEAILRFLSGSRSAFTV